MAERDLSPFQKTSSSHSPSAWTRASARAAVASSVTLAADASASYSLARASANEYALK